MYEVTCVPSASAKPPPTSRATFHGMEAWNSFQEIMDSGWREKELSRFHHHRQKNHNTQLESKK